MSLFRSKAVGDSLSAVCSGQNSLAVPIYYGTVGPLAKMVEVSLHRIHSIVEPVTVYLSILRKPGCLLFAV